MKKVNLHIIAVIILLLASSRLMLSQIPVYVSSSVEDANPSVIEMTFNTGLANIVPAPSAFIARVNTNPRGINAIIISGDKVSLTLVDPIIHFGDVVTIDYIKPNELPLQAPNGDQVASFGLQPVINHCLEKDIDGNKYNTIEIGRQIWMIENLKTTHFRDQSIISLVTGDNEWAGLNGPGYCWYNNDENLYKSTYGGYYNWFAVNSGLLCPSGWHVPTDAEWHQLVSFLDPISALTNPESLIAGDKLKESGEIHWLDNNSTATNESGFTALPGAFRYGSGYGNGSFYYNGQLDIGKDGFWWTSSSDDGVNSWYRNLRIDYSGVYRSYFNYTYGLPVRCLSNFLMPTLTTVAVPVSSIQANSASSGGTGIDEGGYSITVRGVCWSTSHNPTILDSHTIDGYGRTDFTSTLTGLSPNTTYYVRAFTFNYVGASYGNEISFTTLQPPTVVTNTSDYDPTQGEASIYGSLRSAIEYANSNPGNDIITFNIPGSGPYIITPSTSLPNITESLVINGFSQPGASSETSILLIELDGTTAGVGANGLTLNTDNCTIRGLVINRFSGSGIYLDHANGSIIEGNFIGTDKTGKIGIGNGSWDDSKNKGTGAGISLFVSNDNLIGGSSSISRNLISANPNNGIWIIGFYDKGTSTYYKSSGNNIKGNLIGTDIDGVADLGNRCGIEIDTSFNNIIGGLTSEERNIISANLYGIKIVGGDQSKGNSIIGNYIGTNMTGTTSLGNNWGIVLQASETTVGGSTPGARNLICGSPNQGLGISGGLAHTGPSSGNRIMGNYIGVDAAGTNPIPNHIGIYIMNSGNNQIGGYLGTEGNLISGNTNMGLYVGYMDATNNRIEGNLIGTTFDGKTALGNGIEEVDIFGPGGININGPGNIIGSNEPLKRNIISGNLNGISLRDSADNCTVLGNFIGTDITGKETIPNINNGIAIKGGKDNTIGSTTPNTRNVISGNGKNGISLTLSDVHPSLENPPEYSTGNIIQGNYIGTDITGLEPRGNSGSGIYLDEMANDNLIGGTAAGSGNIIAFNGTSGVICGGTEDPSTRNRILSNSIHSNRSLGIDLGNDGITYNDDDDIDGDDPENPDPKPNHLQNYPEIESVSFSPGFVTIIGSLNSEANKKYTLQFFANKVADGSNYGEGQTYLYLESESQQPLPIEVTTDGNGNAPFTETLPIKGIYGQVITATATDSEGNTSEFSKYVGGLADQVVGMDWPVRFVYNATGAENITDGTDITAIENSFKAWTEISTSEAEFENGGPVDLKNADVDDGINLISFMDNEYDWPVGVLAYASKTTQMDEVGISGEIIDADIIVNPAFKDVLIGTSGATGETGTPGFYDIQSIITHELGHTLGLLHSGLTRSTMFFWMHKNSVGKRTLESDDLAWASYKYPDGAFSSTYGTLSGNITYGYDGKPVAGALVTAINALNGISFHAYSDADGKYVIPVLSGSNQYFIHIEPLDGDVNGYPMTSLNISSYIYSNTVYTDYPGEYFNNGDTDASPESEDNPLLTDDESMKNPVSVSITNYDIITNRDLVPPEVLAITPDNESVVNVLPDIIITFSEEVDLTSFSDENIYMQQGAADKYYGSVIQWEGNTEAVIFTPDVNLPNSVLLTLHIKGITDLKGNALVSEYSAYNINTIDPDEIPPRVTGSIPKNGEEGVFVTDCIIVSFSEPVNKATVEGNYTFTSGGTDIDCALSWSNNGSTVTFDPANPMIEGTNYMLTLLDAITDLHGNQLSVDENDPEKHFVEISFTTVLDGDPTTTYIGPGNDVVDVPTNTSIVVDFSEPIYASIFDQDRQDYYLESFMLRVKGGAPISGSYEVLKEDSRIVFRPNTELSYGTTYEINLTTDITDKLGNPLDLENKFPSEFTTSTSPSGPSIDYIEKPTGVAGDEIIISGKGFDPDPANNLVSFAGTIAPVEQATLSSLNVAVPNGTVSGEVTVTVNGSTSLGCYFYIINPTDVLPDSWATSSAGIGTGIHSTDLNGDCTTAYVTNSGSNTVSVVDIDDEGDLTWMYDIPVGEIPMDIALNSTDTRAYVTNYGSNTVSVIDLTLPEPAVIKEINVGINPYGVAVAPDGDYVYVANYTSQNLTGIDVNPNSGGFDHATTNVNLGSGGKGNDVTGDCGLVLVATDDGLKIVNINPQNTEFDCFNCVVVTGSSGTRLTKVDVTGDAGYAIATTEDGRLLIIDVLPESDYFGTAVASTSSNSKITSASNAGDDLHIYATTENHEVLIFEIVPGGIGVPEVDGSYTGTLSLKLVATIPYVGNDAIAVDAQNQRLLNAGSELIQDGSNTGDLWLIPLYAPPQAPVDRIAGLILNVQELMYGSLKRAIGNELIRFLDSAIDYLEAGKTKDAVNKLNTFIVKLKDMIKSHSLKTPEENEKAQEMIDTAREIVIQLGGKPKSGAEESVFTDTEQPSVQDIITKTKLSTIYPNPSREAITIDYEIASDELNGGRVSIQVFDITGRVVSNLVNGTRDPGRYSVSWNGYYENGGPAPRGIYYIRFTACNIKEVQRIMLVR